MHFFSVFYCILLYKEEWVIMMMLKWKCFINHHAWKDQPGWWWVVVQQQNLFCMWHRTGSKHAVCFWESDTALSASTVSFPYTADIFVMKQILCKQCGSQISCPLKETGPVKVSLWNFLPTQGSEKQETMFYYMTDNSPELPSGVNKRRNP